MCAWHAQHQQCESFLPSSRSPSSARPSETTPLRTSSFRPRTGFPMPSNRLKLCQALIVTLSLGFIVGYMSMTILFFGRKPSISPGTPNPAPSKASPSAIATTRPLLLKLTNGDALDQRNNWTAMLALTYAQRADVIRVNVCQGTQ
ncbi:Aste57867_16548 [Aphanomyces stellatus]|uniref:Aste57867_16548 protein n=1 Tax=Aphanomyces stellatus TaxID=120398 RepID=A0A485L8V4_9STRA|nr:hypothetical protein As57867_016491 [Aphanomyces stellatus]VFT93322.1 Aste57867_16548 [Aphanomyces stellatus]